MENILKQLRISKGLEQKECADALGISSRTLARYENGHPICDSFIMHSIAEYYGVTMDFLYKSTNESLQDI